MLRGYRFLIAAACGLALVTTLGVGAYFGSLYSPDHKQYQAVAGDQSGQNDYTGPSQSLPDISGLPGPVERAIANPHPNTGQDHEKRDLAAQEASALWAFWMVLISAASVLITAIGTIFLYKQIVLTREAVEDTGKATKAMERQNELSEAAQRPFVVVEAGPSPTAPNDRGQVMPASFRYRNFGGSAAQIILQAHKVEVLEEPNTRPNPLNTSDGYDRQVPSGEFVGPRGETNFEPAGPIYNSHLEFTEPATIRSVPGPPPELTTAFAPHFNTFFHGFVIYADFEGRFYIRGFCFRYEQGSFRLSDADEALNYDRRCSRDGSWLKDTANDDSRNRG